MVKDITTIIARLEEVLKLALNGGKNPKKHTYITGAP